jgi:hypothetical protein
LVEKDDSTVIDTAYFQQGYEHNNYKYNWVYDEMWQYFSKKFSYMTADQVQKHWSSKRLQVLEVYCSDTSQITRQGELLGLTTVRFGMKHGDLSTFGGRCKLYDFLWITRPEHIWMSPKCGPWSAWNRLNMNKSVKLSAQIASDRKRESVHMSLCAAMFQRQSWRGEFFHAHLEQPDGSDMMWQPEVTDIITHALRVSCDMCSAGNLRHPSSGELLIRGNEPRFGRLPKSCGACCNNINAQVTIHMTRSRDLVVPEDQGECPSLSILKCTQPCLGKEFAEPSNAAAKCMSEPSGNSKCSPKITKLPICHRQSRSAGD